MAFVLTLPFVFALAAALLFTAALVRIVQLYRLSSEVNVLFFLAVAITFAAAGAYLHLICAGTVCFLVQPTGALAFLTAPDRVDTAEAVLMLLASAFSFAALYLVKHERYLTDLAE